MTEHQLCNLIIEHLNYTGLCYCWRVNSGMIETKKGNRVRLNRAGTSDIQGIRKSDGRMICIEVKLPGKEKNLTILQKEYLQKMKDYGALTGLATNGEQALEIVKGKIILTKEHGLKEKDIENINMGIIQLNKNQSEYSLEQQKNQQNRNEYLKKLQGNN